MSGAEQMRTSKPEGQLARVSVLVITFNEEANIAACLEGLRWASEVFVVDSLSTDRTAEIAEEAGARVYLHPFDGYAKQRNWALESLPFSYEWLLMLDADERVPGALADEIASAISTQDEAIKGYYLKRRFFLLGRWLNHGGLYPTWLLRLFKRHSVRIEERPVNEHAVLDGNAGYLKNPFDHCDKRGLSDWIARHDRYADLEAEEYQRERFGNGYRDTIPVRLWGTQAERKRWVKLRLWNRLPLLLRPFFSFLLNYVFKGGFLDGKPGFIYHVLWSFWYPFFIGVKVIEKRMCNERGKAQRPAPEAPEYLGRRGVPPTHPSTD